MCCPVVCERWPLNSVPAFLLLLPTKTVQTKNRAMSWIESVLAVITRLAVRPLSDTIAKSRSGLKYEAGSNLATIQGKKRDVQVLFRNTADKLTDGKCFHILYGSVYVRVQWCN